MADDEIPIVVLDDDDLFATEGQEDLPRLAETAAAASGPDPAPRSSEIASPGASTASRAPGLVWLATRTAAVLAVGTVLTLGGLFVRQRFLAAFYPLPGVLAEPHATLSARGELDCAGCHAPGGLAGGCLGCHVEIDDQLTRAAGFHHHLLAGKDADCARCHQEHLGRGHELVGSASWGGSRPGKFDHPHVAFGLEGAHADLECGSCHEDRAPDEFTLPGFPTMSRKHTFLGLRQECIFCHEDPHAGGLLEECDACHDQAGFRPAPHFTHSERFALDQGHAGIACDRCHVIAESRPEIVEESFPFDRVRGTACADCHASPHRTDFAVDCDHCHREAGTGSSRGGMTTELHALTGFRLRPPHDRVDCEKCHDPEIDYEDRHPDPSLAGNLQTEDACEGCHEDIHGGQFLAVGKRCLDCHDRDRFRPHLFDLDRHALAFPLTEAHASTDCDSCHREDVTLGSRLFVGTPRECASCHESPHAGQFGEKERSCADCHEGGGFLPANFGRREHEPVYALRGSHIAVPCRSCHTLDEPTGSRRFVGTPRECRACHRSPHGGQFAEELTTGGCGVCHGTTNETFAMGDFDHRRRTGHALEGAHADAECSDCHREITRSSAGEGLATIRLYRGTSTACSSCHRDIHRGQFRRDGQTTCTECHGSTARWTGLEFDHDTRTAFPLGAAHEGLSCDRCHLPARLDDGTEVVVYKPLGTECNHCHELASR